MEDISEWPTDLAISVVPHEDSWKVAIMWDGPQQDADRCEMIQAIADRLRNQFDLKGWFPTFLGHSGRPSRAGRFGKLGEGTQRR